MRAAYITRVQQDTGKPETEAVPDPIVTREEPKIKNLAASVNPKERIPI
jgi:hypothetical protein